MQVVIIVIHLLIVIALIGVVLIQRSEGGGLGIGGGSGFMTARGTKSALTRLTGILGACFFITSIVLYTMSSSSTHPASDDIIDLVPTTNSQPATPGAQTAPAAPETAPATPATTGDSVIDQLNQLKETGKVENKPAQ